MSYKGKEITKPRFRHDRLRENLAHYPDGFIRLLLTRLTTEDLFRIATLSDKYCDVALMEIERQGLQRDFEIWNHFQTKNKTNENSYTEKTKAYSF